MWVSHLCRDYEASVRHGALLFDVIAHRRAKRRPSSQLPTAASAGIETRETLVAMLGGNGAERTVDRPVPVLKTWMTPALRGTSPRGFPGVAKGAMMAA